MTKKTIILSLNSPIYTVSKALGKWADHGEVHLHSTSTENHVSTNVTLRLSNWTLNDKNDVLASVLLLLNEAGLTYRVI